MRKVAQLMGVSVCQIIALQAGVFCRVRETIQYGTYAGARSNDTHGKIKRNIWRARECVCACEGGRYWRKK